MCENIVFEKFVGSEGNDIYLELFTLQDWQSTCLYPEGTGLLEVMMDVARCVTVHRVG